MSILRSIIPINLISQSKEYANVMKKRTQMDYYRERGAPDEILKLVSMNNKTYGTGFMEAYIRSHFGMINPVNSEHDGIYMGKKFEIKAPRFGSNGDYFIQHIKPNHDFDYFLIALLQPSGIETSIVRKSDMYEYLKLQKGEGYFLRKKDIETISHGVNNEEDLKAFIHNELKVSFLNNYVRT